MRMDTSVTVLTLNCWDIPYLGISKNRIERLQAIAEELASGKYDLVALQELWSEKDFENIANRVSHVLPYSFYFFSGVNGSGLCILSKGRIIDTGYQRWQLNGYFHKIQHADWFGGKGIGLCTIDYKGLIINFYTTHLHAEYSPNCDEYLHHRICQALEMSQYIAATRYRADLVVVAGDFNTEKSDLVYKIIKQNAGLRDALCEIQAVDSSKWSFATYEHPRNSYRSSYGSKNCPEGQVIDYVMYSCSPQLEIVCVDCDTPLDRIIPGDKSSVSFSDHEAVVVTLKLVKSSNVKVFQRDKKDLQPLLKARKVLDKAIDHVHRFQRIHFAICALLFCLLAGTIHIEIGANYNFALGIARVIFTIILVFCFITGLVSNQVEVKGLKAAISGLKIKIEGIKYKSCFVNDAGDVNIQLEGLDSFESKGSMEKLVKKSEALVENAVNQIAS